MPTPDGSRQQWHLPKARLQQLVVICMEGLCLLITTVAIILTQTACNHVGDSTGTPGQFRFANYAIGTQDLNSGNENLSAEKAAITKVISPKFRAVNLVMLPFTVSTVPKTPASYFNLSTCDSFYYDSGRAKSRCGDSDMETTYAYDFRATYLIPDTFSTLLLFVGPGSMDLTTGSRVNGVATLDPSYRTHRWAMVFPNATDAALSANGINPDYRYIYKYNLFGLISCHELGHSYGLVHALYPPIPPATGPIYGEDDSLNIYHHVYGYSGKCMMMSVLPVQYGASPESANFCVDDPPDSDPTNSCYDQLQVLAP